ncbi:MAG: hypothetical protein GY950_18705, partial [bacterium]|nr:hypothetical protein [bacterium]
MYMSSWFKQIIISRLLPVLTAAVFFFQPVTPLTASALEAAQQDPVTHKVSVDVMLVPVFVVGPDGNPVFDLKKEEFELYANGNPVDIAQFIQFDFQHTEEVVEEVKVKEEKKVVPQPSRAVFIIIDSVFNSIHGYRRTKQIAIDIINNGSPEDMFIVLENKAAGGPRHLAGPDESRKSIIRKIQKLRLPSEKFDRNLHLTREWNIVADSNMYDPLYEAASFENLTNQTKYLEKLSYKNQARQFSRFLARFKYVLKTITRPKVVFLLSEGIAKAAFKTLQAPEVVEEYGRFHSSLLNAEKGVDQQNEFRDQHLFKDLQRVVQAINQGGSVLYTINPSKVLHDDEASGEMSLKYLARESGGRYIGGTDTKKVIK